MNQLFLNAKEHYGEKYSRVFNQLNKCEKNIIFVDSFEHYPLIQLFKNHIVLWHQIETVSPHPYAFSDVNEIVFLIDQMLFSNSYIYISKKIPFSFI